MTDRKAQIRQSLEEVRARTLWLLERVPDECLRVRVHEFYSPIGWHFGHVGRTEEYWVVGEALGRPLLDDALTFILADTADNPRDNRVNIPDRAGLVEYLERTRKSVLAALDESDLQSDEAILADGYAWEFAIQHECQHQETIAEMLQLIQKRRPQASVDTLPWNPTVRTEMIDLPGGEFWMGSDDPHGYDNEKRAHLATVAPFRLAKTPVTAYEWTEFIKDGGYARPELWTDVGWAWREGEGATTPEYWLCRGDGWAYIGPWGARPLQPDEAASGLSAHEADAYARWAGKRLPTEKEWECGASEDGSPCSRGGDPSKDAGSSPRAEGGTVGEGVLSISSDSRVQVASTHKGFRYPWGDERPTEAHANHGLREWGPTPVGRYPATNGLHDLAGNVWEWTASPFLPYEGFEAYPYDGYSKDHMKGAHRVCRGGSWATSPAILRRSFRNWYVPSYRQGFLGLRLADNG